MTHRGRNRKLPPGTDQLGGWGFFIGSNHAFEIYRRYRPHCSSMEHSICIRRNNHEAFFSLVLDPEDQELRWYLGDYSNSHRHHGILIRLLIRLSTSVTPEVLRRNLLRHQRMQSHRVRVAFTLPVSEIS